MSASVCWYVVSFATQLGFLGAAVASIGSISKIDCYLPSAKLLLNSKQLTVQNKEVKQELVYGGFHLLNPIKGFAVARFVFSRSHTKNFLDAIVPAKNFSNS